MDAVNAEDTSRYKSPFQKWVTRKKLFIWLFLEEPFLTLWSTCYTLTMIVLGLVAFIFSVSLQE